ncbi:hypothetical protein [Micromonospora zamorensis]|uniref:hypothetical protein n=1 Tax=Micromonospora zamorensis TaxID=709883 RepID=UPI0033BAD821
MSKRWLVMTEAEALSFAGDHRQILSVDDVTYVVGATAMIIIIDGSDPRQASVVQNFDRLVLREPFPEPAHQRLVSALQIIGFARVDGGYALMGELRKISSRSRALEVGNKPYPHNIRPTLVSVELAFAERLPFDLLDQVRPTRQEPLPSLDWLHTLARDPITALADFVADWYADVPPVADKATSDHALPDPLLAFYRVAAGRSEVLGQFNRIYPADELDPDPRGLVLFGSENQGGFYMLIDPGEADPTVHYDGLEAEREREPLSSFLLQFLLCETGFSSPFTGYAVVTPQQAEHFVEPLQPVPLRPMRWTGDPTRHYVAPGLVVTTTTRDDTIEVYVGARHRCALRTLRYPGFRWDQFDG